jgi:peptide methionine sulfoxide reductase msrA/msrB
MTHRTYSKPPADEIRKRLSPLEFEVTQHDATEPPFHNQYWDNHDDGLYVDVVTGEPLFSSRDKFESGTGWPSFTRPIEPERVVSRRDASHGMLRVEARSRAGDSHLGHVFEDGPAPTGLRYCINSASLRFVPLKDVPAQYPEYANRFEGAPTHPDPALDNACAVPAPGQASGCEATVETAIVAGGCFWGMQDLIRKIPGVLETEVGYTGGTTERPRYDDVKTGRTGHAEAVRVVFDPKILSFEQLLRDWFFRMHDPTTKNRQGNDVGSQYRSAIFVTSDAQRRAAESAIAQVAASGKWKGPIATEIVDAGPFTRAEEYHQDYLVQHPDGYTCHWLRD